MPGRLAVPPAMLRVEPSALKRQKAKARSHSLGSRLLFGRVSLERGSWGATIDRPFSWSRTSF